MAYRDQAQTLTTKERMDYYRSEALSDDHGKPLLELIEMLDSHNPMYCINGLERKCPKCVVFFLRARITGQLTNDA